MTHLSGLFGAFYIEVVDGKLSQTCYLVALILTQILNYITKW
ncbi:hypothetical protein HanXRQr2_Chr03g0090171 [Helianthus annuus]|uniref:Uncharacterized protein n=1 Tax=Helianthus annuus TaxID=4232 RepID=A0A9K3JDN0_HELAN|nr:hypothetical protein HanXRQr2_Chr03g0090171 [Helianthus annuus]